MGLFNRGQGASSLILDEARAIRAYLGEQLVWDGTMDAFVSAPRIMVSVSMRDPLVSATASTVVPFITASGQVLEPAISGTATVRPETAILVTGAVYSPDVSADALIEVPAISVSAIMLAPTVSEAFDATVEAPFIQVTAGVYSPQITVDYSAAAPIIAAFAELLDPLITATGTAVVNAPMIAVTGTVAAPEIHGSSTVAAPVIAVSATVLAPEIRRDAKVMPPLIAGTATLYVPVVQANNFNQVSMTKNGDQQLAASAWTEVGPWTAGSSSTVSGNALRVKGSGNATIQVGSEWPTSTSVKDWRVLKNGTVVWTKGSGAGLTLADTFALAVVDGDLLTCEAWNSSGVATNRIVKTGANTYLRVVPA